MVVVVVVAVAVTVVAVAVADVNNCWFESNGSGRSEERLGVK